MRYLILAAGRHLILAGALGVAAAGAWAAKPNAAGPAAGQRPKAFEAVIRCRAIAGDAERLRCFDAAAAAMEQAAARRDIVVIDRQQVRETRRKLFGIEVPRLNLFGGGDDKGEQVSELDGVVSSAAQDGNGHWIVTLEEGGTWAQIDDTPVAVWPRAGTKIVIKRAALGSYMMRIGGQSGVRAHRRF
jgi:hypothetical protein